jgi:hypothetical protein
MSFIEAPTTFYLGRETDPATKKPTTNMIYYDSRHLTTHAVVMGMTGSGKTGLCIDILEEAMLDNIPAIIVDPKGDITNLMLNFPELRPTDFEPWVNVDDARRANMDIPQFAAKTAQQWREGLAEWGIVPDRLLWLQHASKISIYTPGADAGLPVSILASLRAPKDGWIGNEEELREQIAGIVTALLGLVGRESQPVQDKEHVLLSNIFEYAWSRGKDLTIQDLVLQVQTPPFDKLGVFPVNEYLSARIRSKLATELNNILAAPSFQSWLMGESLDIQNLMYQPNGRPRISIFYTAHLNDAERQLVLTLLLENMISWMRTLSGTTSLRALLYIDEMFGYFPPYPFNPPTKQPLLRLLKQARAFGIGLILATQNPGDLDYKGLGNTGTWFIGRLNTENDKQRLIAGLQSLNEGNGESLDVKTLSAIISDLDPRSFLLSNVHDQNTPLVFQTRWTMSYLRGPLTKQQVNTLMKSQRAELLNRLGMTSFMPAIAPTPDTMPEAAAPPPAAPSGQAASYAAMQAALYAQRPVTPPPPPLPELPPERPAAPAYAPPPPEYNPLAQPTYDAYAAQASEPAYQPPAQRRSSRNSPAGYNSEPPAFGASVPQYFFPYTLGAQQALAAWQQRTNFAAASAVNTALAYQPMLLAQTVIRFQDKKTQTFTTRLFTYQISDISSTGLVHWEDYIVPPVDTRSINGEPTSDGIFGEVPGAISDPKRLAALKREMVDMLYSTARLPVPYSPALDLYGSPDADINAFYAQVQQGARERRDADVDVLTRKYEDILDTMNDRMLRFQTKANTTAAELQTNKRMKTLTTGEAILGLMQGRAAFTLSRMNMAEYWKQRTQGRLELNQVQIQQINEEIQELQGKFQLELQFINEKWAKAAVNIDQYQITAYKKDIIVELFGIGWQPFWYAEIGGQSVLVQAF